MKVNGYLIPLALASLAASSAGAVPSVLTQAYDNTRSGANLAETILTPANVSSSTFGKLYSFPVDDEVFTQPLYMPGLTIGGGTHNVLFVTTMGNSVYAFDADNQAASNTPLWSVNLGPAAPSSKFGYSGGGSVSHNGIYSTPVIDPSTNTLYVVTYLWNVAAQTVSTQLHALDVTTGNEKFGGPVTVAAPSFNSDVNIVRAGLLLLDGTLYLAVASHGDFHLNTATQKTENYVGFVLGYNAQTLARVATLNAETGGAGAGIWQGGRGLASDGTYIYVMTANSYKYGKPDYSESFLQLNPANLAVVSQYQDPDYVCLNTIDLDLSSAGPLVVPGSGTNLLLGGGKEGKVYILQLNQSLSGQTPQSVWGTSNHPTLPAEGGSCVDTRATDHGFLKGNDEAFWSRPGAASYFYALGDWDNLMSWQVTGNTLTQSTTDSPANTEVNAMAISSNGNSNGIVWIAAPQASGPEILYAYNALPSGGHLTQLWTSAQVPTRDLLGTQSRYGIPTVVNGKVYVPNGANQVVVYGLLPSAPSLVVTSSSPTAPVLALDNVGENVTVTALGGFTGTVNLSASGLPPGVTYSFKKPTLTLTATTHSATTELLIVPANAVPPLKNSYTVMINASGTGGINAYANLQLVMRNGKYTSITSAGCNASNVMALNLAWQIDGSTVPSVWIQDPTTPNFPGRQWIDPAQAIGGATTPYLLTGIHEDSFFWLIDQSAGIPATFDNALQLGSMGPHYACP